MDAWSNDSEQDGLKAFLDEKVDLYNAARFIETDPIQVPHQFDDPRDIEISAFLTATIAWGQKTTIIANARRLFSLMQASPYEFIMENDESGLDRFLPFVHRTFNGIDCIYFLTALKRLYKSFGGLQEIFESSYALTGDLYHSMASFRELFFEAALPGRTSKHIANVRKGASGKRINMYLRWMVRHDQRGVDFGIWKGIPMHALYIPLDVHTGHVARKLGLLKRTQNDWKAVIELTERLREFDQEDPVRYDFALFGLGSFEGF